MSEQEQPRDDGAKLGSCLLDGCLDGGCGLFSLIVGMIILIPMLTR